MGFKLAELFVDINANDKPAMQAFGRVRGAFEGLGSKLMALGGAIGGGMFLKNAIDGASNLAETVSKTQQVFGPASDTVLGFADDVAKRFGLVKQPILDAAAVFGLMGKGAGMAEGEAAKFSTTMAMMAADASSFYNVPLDVALEKIRAGLSGEAEPLRAFGVFLSDAAVKAKAAEMGLTGLNGELSEGQKIAARAALIQQQLSASNGDLARTIGGTANQQRKLMGDLTNATNEFGAAIMPVWNGLLQAATAALSGLSGWLASTKDGIGSWASEIGGWLGAVGVMFRNWEISAQIVGLSFWQTIMNAGEIVRWLFAEVFPKYLGWFTSDWVNGIRTALDFVWTVFSNVFTNIKNLVGAAWEFITNPAGGFNFEFTPLLEGFDAAAAKLPEIAAPHLNQLQGEIDALVTKMGDAETAFQQGAAAAQKAGQAPPPVAAAAADQAAKAADDKVRTTTLEGFAKNLLESAFSKDKGLKAQEETAKNTAAIAQALTGGAGAIGPIVGVAG